MIILFILLSPIIAITVDFLLWAQVCFGVATAKKDNDWSHPTFKYIALDGKVIRITLLSLCVCFCFLMSARYGQELLLSLLALLSGVSYLAFTSWSFYSNLKEYYERNPRS